MYLLTPQEEEEKVEQKEGRLKKRIMDIKGSIPPLQDDLDVLSEALNSFPQLDPSPLALIVEGRYQLF